MPADGGASFRPAADSRARYENTEESGGVPTMSAPSEFAADSDTFAEMLEDAQRQLDLAARLPHWPFLARSGYVTIFEYDRLMGGSFGTVVQALAHAHDDRTVTVVGLEPAPAYYRDGYGYLPAFRIAGEPATERYAAALCYEPGGDPTGAMAYSINVLGIVGSSNSWSVWGQRDWEIGLVLAPAPEGPWLQQPVPWFGREVDLDSIRSPVGWGSSLSEDERSMFWRNLRERGSGP